MSKVTLDMSTFKALASDTRLDILRALDGKNMSLSDISKATSLNKATLHEHLTKLHEAGLVKRKEREGHKWVYYKLSWKGECLLHPENTKIVVLFTTTFFTLLLGIVSLVSFAKGKIIAIANTLPGTNTTSIYAAEETGNAISDLSFEAYRNVANVPTTNQTLVKITQALNDNATSQGVWQISREVSELKWSAINTAESQEVVSKLKDGLTNLSLNAQYGADDSVSISPDVILDEGEKVTTFSLSNGVSPENTMVAIFQDPTLLYIAIACIIIFSILLSIGIWRLWVNKTPKI